VPFKKRRPRSDAQRLKNMAAGAAGGAVTAAKHLARGLGDMPGAEAGAYIVQRQKAQLAKAAIQARLLELELQERRGELRPVVEIQALLAKVGAAIRRIMRAAPAQVDQLGLPEDQAALLRKAVATVMHQMAMTLANELTALAKETQHQEAAEAPPIRT